MRSEAFLKIIIFFFYYFFFLGGGGSGWGGGGQGGCEWRSEAFVKMKIFGRAGTWVRGVGLGGVRVDGNREVKLV